MRLTARRTRPLSGNFSLMASPTRNFARRLWPSSAQSEKVGIPRAVVDACALAPAILFRDNLYRAMVEQAVLRPVLCPEMVEETSQALEEMLADRSYLTESDRRVVQDALRFVARVAWHVDRVSPGYVVPELGAHQKDAHLFWACERGQADCLITVEPRLWRDLRTWRGIPILKPTEALMHLGLDARRAPSCPE